MGKRIFAVPGPVVLGVLIAAAAMMFTVDALAQQKKQAAPQPSPAEVLAQQKKQAELKARQDLEAQEWVVYLTPESGRGRPEQDTVIFTKEGKVSSKNLLAKGYTDSNFRLTVDNAVVVWETMKVNQDKDLVFLRGELKDGAMAGSYFYKPEKGRTETFYFTTVKPAEPVREEAPKKKKR